MAPPSRLRKPFGEALRDLREDRGFAQEELALRAGIHRTYVSQLERGLKTPSLAAIEALSDVLECLPSELVERAEVVAGPRWRRSRRGREGQR